MTLIAVYNSEGCVGRCDARCYNAESPDCDCICGGRNHGAGRERAIENTVEMTEELLAKATDANGVKINPKVYVQSLFEEVTS